MRNKLLALAMLLVVSAVALAEVPDDELFQAMQDEIDRSMAELQMDDLEAPYFISYTIWDVSNASAQATLGVIQSSLESRRRLLSVQVRVGDYSMDNTNYLGSGFYGFSGLASLPLEDDYTELRRQLWLTTDIAYKEALENLSQKRAALQNRVRDEELPDFSRESSLQINDSRQPIAWDRASAEDLVRGLSSLFRPVASIQSSRVELSASSVTTRYVNSEGSRFLRTTPSISLAAMAYAQAEDGRPIDDAITALGRQPDDLPSRSEMAESIETMIERMSAMRQAPLLERYNGPVLFTGQAAAELFAQRLAPSLVANRIPVSERPQAGYNPTEGAGGQWEERIGGRVLPRFLTVVDDPTVDVLQGQALVSSYRVDDEAVAASPTLLVENGRLKTLLTGRTPVTGIGQSTGNARDGTVLPSTIIATTENGLSKEALEQELIALAEESGQEFGLLVTRIANPAVGNARVQFFGGFMNGGFGQTAVIAQDAFRVYPDGRRERVRNLALSGLSAASFRDIIAVSDETHVHTAPYPLISGMGPGMMIAAGGTSALPLASWAVPSLLFEELSVRKPSGEYPTLPIVSRPQQ